MKIKTPKFRVNDVPTRLHIDVSIKRIEFECLECATPLIIPKDKNAIICPNCKDRYQVD